MSARRKQRGCVMYRRCPVNKTGDRLEEDQGTKAAQNKAAAEHNMLNLKLSREGTGCEKKIKDKETLIPQGGELFTLPSHLWKQKNLF